MYSLQKGLKYCALTGVFFRRGNVAGTLSRAGYIRIRYLGDIVSAHRLAFLAVTGSWPEGDVDHINGVRHDNRWSNLRDVTTSVNLQNQRDPHENNQSGYLGVSWKTGKWKAQIKLNGVVRILGRFDDPAVAHQAYLKAKRRLHAGCTI